MDRPGGTFEREKTAKGKKCVVQVRIKEGERRRRRRRWVRRAMDSI